MKYLLFAALLLTGCARISAQPVAQTLVYDCEGGYRLVATRDPGPDGGLRLELPTGAHTLPPVPAASGARYAGDGLVFWSKGQNASFTSDGQAPRQCRNNAPAAIWEGARRRGVLLRATGNEPGWYLEIGAEKIIYAGEYGQQFLDFPFDSSMVSHQQASTIYRTANQKHHLEARVETGDCFDSMTGEKFTRRVTLQLDRQTLYGCGRQLN